MKSYKFNKCCLRLFSRKGNLSFNVIRMSIIRFLFFPFQNFDNLTSREEIFDKKENICKIFPQYHSTYQPYCITQFQPLTTIYRLQFHNR